MGTHWTAATDGKKGKVIVCTGERMADLIERVYRPVGLLNTTFEPKHARGLSNEFRCYANFECESWKWRDAAKDRPQT
jgi:hypothetical protein